MAKRGRPSTNGIKPGWVLHRDVLALLGYDQARSAGEKHAAALTAAVAAVREEFPTMPMSETTARRILVRYRSATVVETFLPIKTDQGVGVIFAPVPRYPRVNAKLAKRRS